MLPLIHLSKGIAKKGHYGSYLMDDFALVHRLVSAAHEALDVPVSGGWGAGRVSGPG
jgi:hypothetical protein